MFAVGDKIVYPMHGAGVVQAIEQHELAGENVDYLVMMILLSDMRVMVPLKNVERVGLRHIIDKEQIPGIEEALRHPVVAVAGKREKAFHRRTEASGNGAADTRQRDDAGLRRKPGRRRKMA